MEAIGVAEFVDELNQAVADAALAARCEATTVLITADSAAAAEHLARQIHCGKRSCRVSVRTRRGGRTLPSDPAVLTQTCGKLLDMARGGTLFLDRCRADAGIRRRTGLIETFTGLQAVTRTGMQDAPHCSARQRTCTDRIPDGRFSEQLFYRLNIAPRGRQERCWGVGLRAAAVDGSAGSTTGATRGGRRAIARSSTQDRLD